MKQYYRINYKFWHLPLVTGGWETTFHQAILQEDNITDALLVIESQYPHWQREYLHIINWQPMINSDDINNSKEEIVIKPLVNI